MNVDTPAPAPRVSEPALIARTLAFALMAAATCMWNADPDLWGHLRFGLDSVRDHALTAVDPYSFTSDRPWINHEWLSEAAMGVAYLAGGVYGLLLLKILLVGGTFALLAFHSRHASAPARWWILAAVAVLSAPVTMTVRPQLWTALLLTMITITTDWKISRLALLWPMIFAVWANAHGGWIVGLGVVAAWIAGSLLDTRDWRSAASRAGVLALCIAATLLTPYGLELWRFIAETVGVNRHDVTEWRPIWVEGATVWIGSLILVAVLLRYAAWSWSTVLPVLMLAVGSAKVGRLGALWVLAAAALLLPRWRALKPVPVFPPALTAIVVAVAMLPAAVIAAQSRCLPILGWRPPDVEAAGALMGASGRLMVPFDWGEFAIWHFGPALKVSFDGRRETVYSAARIAEQHGLGSGDPRIGPFIEHERPEYVWLPLPGGERLAAELPARGYRVDVETSRSIILTRQDLEPLKPAPMSRCFP
jgi:hypothetical protein